jgi:hypothetical protein
MGRTNLLIESRGQSPMAVYQMECRYSTNVIIRDVVIRYICSWEHLTTTCKTSVGRGVNLGVEHDLQTTVQRVQTLSSLIPQCAKYDNGMQMAALNKETSQ